LPPAPFAALSVAAGALDPRKTGSLLRASGISIGLVAASSSVETAVIGVGEFVRLVMTRDPVTTTLSVEAASWPSAADVRNIRLAVHSRAVRSLEHLLMISPCDCYF
jgi:hypothetical protein